MGKPKLQKIPNSDKYRIVGLNKEQIDTIKEGIKKGDIVGAFAALGAAGFMTDLIKDFDLDIFGNGELSVPDVPIADDELPVPTPEPNIDEILTVIDIDDTVNNFEEMGFDDDLIADVITDDAEVISMEQETIDYIESDEIIDDLNNEDGIDGTISNDEFLDADDFADNNFDDEGYVIDNEPTDELIEDLQDDGFDKDIIDEVIDEDLDNLEIDNETQDYINSDEILADLNDENNIDGVEINDDFVDEEISREGLLDPDFFDEPEYNNFDDDNNDDSEEMDINESDDDDNLNEFDNDSDEINDDDTDEIDDDNSDEIEESQNESDDFNIDEMPDNI